MAIKTISQFPSGIPADNDYILFEQNGEGKSAPLESLPIPTSVQNKLDTKVNYSDSLAYEEIMATNADLTNKVSSASALRNLALIVNLPFRERGLSTDLNKALDSGAYTFIPEKSANNPLTYGVLLVINPKLYYVVQIAISVTGEGIKYRFSQDGGGSWLDWRFV